jgi:hypothetical protein
MRRTFVVTSLLALVAHAHADDPIPNYFPQAMPCKIEKNDDGDGQREVVTCKDDLLDKKSFRELSILRNTIYARYGWDGYRKPWLRDYFHRQPWFKPDPKFSYKHLLPIDRKNAHFVAVRENSYTNTALKRMLENVSARHGKVWHDTPRWKLKSGKIVTQCDPVADAEYLPPEGDPEAESVDCRLKREDPEAKQWYKPNPAYTDAMLTADDRIEIGLISRALGQFALDDESRGKAERSLDRLVKVEELRQLSMRDLRFLRNTIYARKGRAFKSPLLQEHFRLLKWYKVNPSYSDDLLSMTDQRNIALIKSVENEFGGPLADEDFLVEPQLDGA